MYLKTKHLFDPETKIRYYFLWVVFTVFLIQHSRVYLYIKNHNSKCPQPHIQMQMIDQNSMNPQKLHHLTRTVTEESFFGIAIMYIHIGLHMPSSTQIASLNTKPKLTPIFDKYRFQATLSYIKKYIKLNVQRSQQIVIKYSA